jgi:hypothetical protein
MNQARKRLRGRLRSAPLETRQQAEHGLGLREVDVAIVRNVPAVPPERRPRVLLRLRLENEQQQLERFGEPDVLKLGRSGERDSRVSAVESAPKTAVG